MSSIATPSIHHPDPGEWVWGIGGEAGIATHVAIEGPQLVFYTEVPHASGYRPIHAMVPVKQVAELLVDDPVCAAEIDLAIAFRQLRIVQEAWVKAFGKEEEAS